MPPGAATLPGLRASADRAADFPTLPALSCDDGGAPATPARPAGHTDGAVPMPILRTYKAAKGQYKAAKGHIWDNLLLWLGACTAVGLVALLVRWGTLAAICFMMVGLLVMMISEKGTVLTHEPAAEDDQPT